MKVQVQDLGKLRREVQIEIPFDDIRGEYQQVKDQLRNTRLRGFRPGKFPKGWMKSRFRSSMAYEIRERLFPQFYSRALQSENLIPAVPPTSLNIDFDEKKPLSFKVELEIAPTLPEIDYDKLALEEQELEEVTDKDIDEMLQQLRRARSVREPKEAGVVEKGDLVTFDARGTMDGEPLPEEQQIEKSEFEVGGEFFTEFSDAVLGMAVEETKTVTLEMASTFNNELQGKSAEFEITIQSIELLTLPELDEEFFKSYGHDTEEDLRKAVREMQSENKKNNRMTDYREQLLPQLVRQLEDIDLPESSIAEREKALKEEKNEAGEELTEEQIDQRMEAHRDRLRRDFLVDHIFRSVALQLDEATLANRFSNAAGMMGLSAQDFYNHRYGQVMMNSMVAELRGEQALNHVIEKLIGPETASEASDNAEEKQEAATEQD